jgi:hypothetical protein
MEKDNIIEVRGLVKNFKKVAAVRGIDFVVKRGEFFAFSASTAPAIQRLSISFVQSLKKMPAKFTSMVLTPIKMAIK